MTVFLGTLWSSIKQIKAPYVFDWEHEIALQAMQGNWASSLSEGVVSCIFSICGGNLSKFSIYGGDGHSNSYLFSDIKTPI